MLFSFLFLVCLVAIKPFHRQSYYRYGDGQNSQHQKNGTEADTANS
jgi:hypothetical protein